jgi:hypothetical protein
MYSRFGPKFAVTKTRFLPSGDHEAVEPLVELWRRFVIPSPSGYIKNSDVVPSILFWKAIREPSGDQTGWVYQIAVLKIERTSPLSTSIT